jgi:CO/xanthine dehydrogenase FAD-binding subunit
MKSAAFTHHSPKTLQEALVLLGQCENAKVLAGGQSLMELMSSIPSRRALALLNLGPW